MRTGRRGPTGSWNAGGTITVTVVVVIVSASLIIRFRHAAQSTEPPSVIVAVPPTADTKWDDAWPRLAITGFPARPLEEIRAAYAFAVRRPDVLHSLPCFCGCKRLGHDGNEACYVRSRSIGGVPNWTDHAISCGMCIDITHEAIVMTVAGESVDAIRRAIEAKYQVR